jgi:hypothetical protein
MAREGQLLAMSAVIAATCLTLVSALAGAAPGSTIRLGPAKAPCPLIEVTGFQSKGAPVVIEAGETVFENGMRIKGSDGITIRGGEFHSIGEPTPYALHVRGSSRIRIEGVRFTKSLRGLVVGKSQDVAIIDSRFFDLVAEGINLAGVDGFEVRGNDVRGFSPRPSMCTGTDGKVETRVPKKACEAAGGSWKDGHHPDCIQFWGGTRRGVVTGNRCTGEMQGIFGPADEMLVENNVVEVTFPNAIRMTGTGNRVRNNVVKAAPGARFKPMILLRGEGNMACGNAVETGASPEATRACTAKEKG